MENNFQSVPTEEVEVKEENLPENKDDLFGIGLFKPEWLQRFADPKVYLVIFCIVGVVEGAYFTYTVGVLSTLEKRYAFESKISGIILIADNISASIIGLLVGFYGRKVHKPRMIAFGMILVSVSSFLSALPYFLYGPALHFLSRDDLTFGNKKQEYCGSVSEEEGCENSENNYMVPAVTILFVANFLNGFGYVAYYTVGTAYLDDNVKKKNSPMYFSRERNMNARFKTLQTSRSTQKLIVVSRDETCGIGSFTPRWLQAFADPKIYLLVFSAVGVLHGAYFTYFIGILTTLEKRYAFSSQTAGIILIADKISPIFTSLLFGYFSGKTHKPRLVACCMMLVVLGCFLSAAPFFMYGPGIHILSKGNIRQNSDIEYCESKNTNFICEAERTSSIHSAVIILFLANFLTGFGYTACHTISLSYLDDNVKKKKSSLYFTNFLFLSGFGYTASYTISLPYLENNVKKKKSSLYFSAMASLRIFGPALGFLLSSFCLQFYEDPFYEPGIDLNNPRWVGAWWMGFLILGVILLFFTAILALFPRELPERFRSEKKGKEKDEQDEDKSLPKLKDFPQEMRRLLKNPILVCHIISITFKVNGFTGYFVFMPKFMESQYQQSASDASLFSGATGLIFMLLGILLGGFVIKKFKPRPRYLTGYMVLVEIFSVLGLLVSMFLGCPPLNMPGTNLNEDETLNLYNECNVGCGCTRRVFEPVCGEDGVTTFFSPCFAGCPNMTGVIASAVSTTLSPSSNKTVYEACTCTSGLNNTFMTASVTNGFCSSDCNMFLIYIILLCIFKFISSTARVGNTLIAFRCVDSKDKSFALGAIASTLAVFAFIPYPLVYGALTDSACLVWEESCSKTGNCWLYDSDKFRYYLHGMSMLLISIGICFDGIVFLLSDRLSNFYGEEDEDKGQGEDRIARWLKEEEEEDIIFSKLPKKNSVFQMDPVT